MAAKGKDAAKCATIIPAEWKKFTGPAYHNGMTPANGRSAWYGFLREQALLKPTPKVYRGHH